MPAVLNGYGIRSGTPDRELRGTAVNTEIASIRDQARADSGCGVGIITISDRASAGLYEDRSGPAIRACLGGVLATSWHSYEQIVPDEWDAIETALVSCCDSGVCNLVVTTGGTGPAKRDITPEVTEAVCDRMLPGFGELMRAVSLRSVPTAILSRQTAGIRGRSLIINLPGSPSAICDCLMAVLPAIPYCLDLIGGPYVDTDPAKCRSYRPKHAVKGGASAA